MRQGVSLWAAVQALALLSTTAAHPRPGQYSWERRQIDQGGLKDEYDFVIVGGGQSGLVVANRLSEDPSVTVLVVEYGYLNNSLAILEPNSANGNSQPNRFNLTSVPQPSLAGRAFAVLAAAVVGGGSTVNGMFLNRGSARDYDDWGRLNGNNADWTFAGLLPYFRKSVHFQHPLPELTADFNITWDDAAYGDEGSPIRASIANYQFPGMKQQWQAMTDVGLQPQVEGALGNSHGIFWIPNAIDRDTVTRSYARNRYFDPARDRPNLHLLPAHRVNEIIFDGDKRAAGIKLQARRTPNGEGVVQVKARKEIVLAAGALHSPVVLQRSGVGPAGLLERAGVPIIVDLPGVGGNFQDHASTRTSWSYAKNVSPNPTWLTNNQTFLAWANEEWTQHRRGPLSRATPNAAALVPVNVLAPNGWESIVDDYRAQDRGAHLPAGYTDEQVAGYEAQRRLLAEAMTASDAGFVEIPFAGLEAYSLYQMKPASRGTINLDTTDRYANPVVDFNAFANPVDVRLQMESVRFVRRYHASAVMRDTFDPRETVPGGAEDDEEHLESHVRVTSGPSTAHLSGTCSMMPRELGGVVDVDLRVYGVTGLSVADASMMPMVPGTHLCATVYAVAEKAADLIKARHAK